MKARQYKNATVVKFDNRRVIVEKLDGGDFGVLFRILTDKDSANDPSSKHSVYKDKVKTTTIRISKKAALALHFALQTLLSQD